jgi:hypothetical protein
MFITYYSELCSMGAINNPHVTNGCHMRSSGFFEEKDGYLKKTAHNRGRIFCDDSSKLFDVNSGQVRLTLSFPQDISKGVLYPLGFSDKSHFLWGVNMGVSDIGRNSIGVFFTKNGIEFRFKTPGGNYSVVDDITDIDSNSFFDLDLFWDKDEIVGTEEKVNALIRVNGENISGSFFPIVDDSEINSNFYSAVEQEEPSPTSSFSGLPFELLENSFNYNNVECCIRKIIISNGSEFGES